jgi:membrane protease YdiL (CAAX protease family)
MSDHLPVGAAIILASLLFVVLHLGSRGVSAFIFAHSLTFGMAYHLTDSLVGVMLAHTSFDIWALAMLQRELAREGLLMD